MLVQKLLIKLRTILKTHKITRVLLIPFLIFCALFIWKVVDIYLLKSPGIPSGVLVSNTGSDRASVTYINSPKKLSCALIYAFIPPDLRLKCENNSLLVKQDFQKLYPNTKYRLILAGNFRIFLSSSAVMGEESAPKLVPLPIFQTLSKSSKSNQSESFTLIGQVVDEEGIPQTGALIAALESGADTNWSARTNTNGNFSLTVPKLTLIDKVSLSIWSESGFLAINLPVRELNREIQKFTVKKYE